MKSLARDILELPRPERNLSLEIFLCPVYGVSSSPHTFLHEHPCETQNEEKKDPSFRKVSLQTQRGNGYKAGTCAYLSRRLARALVSGTEVQDVHLLWQPCRASAGTARQDGEALH